MASRYKDRQPAPGCKAEAERLAQVQQRDQVAPNIRAKARGARTSPRRGYRTETRVSAPFRKAKAGPKLGKVAQASMDARIEAAISKVEANIRDESAARVAAVHYVPFRQLDLREALVAWGIVTPA